MNDFSPYESPRSTAPLPASGLNAPRPTVLTWYTVYVVLMALMYFGVMVVGVVFVALSSDFADADMDQDEVRLMGAIYGVLGLVLGLVFGIGLIVPRKTWGWIYGIVLICLGLTSCCTMPACIPLLIFWLKPEVKRHFGMKA